MSIYCLSYAKIQVNIEYRKYIRIVLFSASITWRWVFLGDTDGSFRELTHCVREVNKHLIYIVILQTKVLLSVNSLLFLLTPMNVLNPLPLKIATKQPCVNSPLAPHKLPWCRLYTLSIYYRYRPKTQYPHCLSRMFAYNSDNGLCSSC